MPLICFTRSIAHRNIGLRAQAGADGVLSEKYREGRRIPQRRPAGGRSLPGPAGLPTFSSALDPHADAKVVPLGPGQDPTSSEFRVSKLRASNPSAAPPRGNVNTPTSIADRNDRHARRAGGYTRRNSTHFQRDGRMICNARSDIRNVEGKLRHLASFPPS